MDIEPGDKLRWTVSDDETLAVDIVRQPYGAFKDDDMVAPMDGDGLETYNTAGHEGDESSFEDT